MCKCLYSYKELESRQIDFHPSCARKMFGIKEQPLMEYTQADMERLASEIIRSQTTLTGVRLAYCITYRILPQICWRFFSFLFAYVRKKQ